MITDIIEQLKRDEGFRPTPYLDSVGKKTIGYGHNLIARPLPGVEGGITVARGELILLDDVADIESTLARAIPWLTSLDDARQGVLLNMSFNIGVHGVQGFHNMLAYTQSKQFSVAADQMIASKWYTQVGARAERLVKQMRTGLWQ